MEDYLSQKILCTIIFDRNISWTTAPISKCFSTIFLWIGPLIQAHGQNIKLYSIFLVSSTSINKILLGSIYGLSKQSKNCACYAIISLFCSDLIWLYILNLGYKKRKNSLVYKISYIYIKYIYELYNYFCIIRLSINNNNNISYGIQQR